MKLHRILIGTFLLCWVSVAYADTGGSAGPTWSLAEVMALFALVIAGVGAVVDAARAVLHFTAPRTATPLDDRAAAVLDSLHDRIVTLERIAPVVVPPAPALVPATKSSASVATPVATLLGLVLLGAVILQPACGVPATAGNAVVTCAKADQGALEAAVIRLLAAPSWSAFESEAIAAGETIGGCAMLAAISKYHPPAMSLAPQDTHALVERVRAHFGGVTWVTAQGPQ